MKQLKQQYFRPVLPLFREHRAGLLACLGCLCLLFSALPLAAADRFVSFSNGDFLLNEGGKVGIFADETDGISTYFVIFILQLRPKLKRYPNTNAPIGNTKKKLIMRSSDADSDSSSAL